MQYTFRTHPCAPALRPQIARILEKQTELTSRAAVPALWSITNRLNQMPAVSPEVSQQRRARERIYVPILLALGIFVLVPGLMPPRTPALIACGCFCLLSALVLLLIRRKKRETPFERAAAALQEDTARRPDCELIFDENGLSAGESFVPLADITSFFVTDDLFAFVMQERILLLQHSELQDADPEEFAEWIKPLVHNTFTSFH